jgi:hypothetical protein
MKVIMKIAKLYTKREAFIYELFFYFVMIAYGTNKHRRGPKDITVC